MESTGSRRGLCKCSSCCAGHRGLACCSLLYPDFSPVPRNDDSSRLRSGQDLSSDDGPFFFCHVSGRGAGVYCQSSCLQPICLFLRYCWRCSLRRSGDRIRPWLTVEDSRAISDCGRPFPGRVQSGLGLHPAERPFPVDLSPAGATSELHTPLPRE
jgi:hypothetical protein